MLIGCLFCLILSFTISFAISPLVIKLIVKMKARQNVLHYVDAHAQKQGTPTMCGIIFIVGTMLSAFFAFNQHYTLAIICVVAFFAFGLLGFLDDYIKIRSGHNEGLKPYQKIIGQLGISIILAFFVWKYVGSEIIIPFTLQSVDIGIGVIPLIVITIVALTNAVNLLDGLDGLCSGVSIVYILFFVAIMALNIPNLNSVFQVENTNLIIVGCCLVGGLLAFEIYNGFPAKVFMGDTGSLAIGGMLSALAVFSGMELYVLILGTPYVVTALSDIIQVLHFKRTGKRVFLMAPLHHHFEKKGIHENKIVIVYIVITIIIGVITYALTKCFC